MKKKRYQPHFTLDEIQQLLDWYDGEFSGSAKLHAKLLRIIRRKMKGAKNNAL